MDRDGAHLAILYFLYLCGLSISIGVNIIGLLSSTILFQKDPYLAVFFYFINAAGTIEILKFIHNHHT